MDEDKIIKLDNLSILEVSGKGAADLLQGQITCDVNKINKDTSCLGALCNVKGRVISSFVVSSNEENEFILIGPREMLIKTKQVLSKYIPFYQVKSKLNDFYSFYGIKRSLFKQLYKKEIKGEGHTVKINNSKFITYLDKEFLLAICDELDSSSLHNKVKIENKIDNWLLDEIFFHNVEISEENSEKYTPHELNYDITKRIDFDKGCYTGQEVVARMHYRSKNLPRLFLAESNSKNLKENTIICNQKDNKVGNLVKVINLSDKSICLISTKEKNLNLPLKVRGTNSPLDLSKAIKFAK